MNLIRQVVYEFLISILIGLVLLFIFRKPLFEKGLLQINDIFLIYIFPSIVIIFISLRVFKFFNKNTNLKFRNIVQPFSSKIWLLITFLIVHVSLTYVSLYYYVGNKTDFLTLKKSIYSSRYQSLLSEFEISDIEIYSEIFLVNNQQLVNHKLIPLFPIILLLLFFARWLLMTHLSHYKMEVRIKKTDEELIEKEIIQKLKKI